MEVKSLMMQKKKKFLHQIFIFQYNLHTGLLFCAVSLQDIALSNFSFLSFSFYYPPHIPFCNLFIQVHEVGELFFPFCSFVLELSCKCQILQSLYPYYLSQKFHLFIFDSMHKCPFCFPFSLLLTSSICHSVEPHHCCIKSPLHT